MNKPAPKEPSMDEILSSIRQIIADDDAGAAPKKPAMPAPPMAPVARSFAPPPPRPVLSQPVPEPEPFALSSEQILREVAAEDEAGSGLSFDEILGGHSTAAPLVDPDDITFEPEEEDEDEPASVMAPVIQAPRPQLAPAPVYERPAPRPATSVSMAAPMPDPTLSSDIAEELLEPTTQSAVKSTFAKLSNLSTIGSGVTIEAMMRDMMRPMLKEWLDENLPSIVERMVEKEIVRVSRGGR